ncbi:hypothetical protein ACNI65_21835 [Roseateles sp. So40a]|uniref:hypothetical protein n=1 Tax=Roseateles sp. So40a TaxID=3400226 RepID=UPI003A897DF2
MTLLVRTVFVCLLAVAIPLQGAVAAAMRCCGMEHHQVDTALDEEHAGHDHHDQSAPSDVLDEHLQDGHGHAQPRVHGVDSSAAHNHGLSHGDLKQSGAAKASAKCNVCASCCGAAALPSRAATVIQVATEKDRYCASVAPDAEFTTSGPERPPRTSFL